MAYINYNVYFAKILSLMRIHEATLKGKGTIKIADCGHFSRHQKTAPNQQMSICGRFSNHQKAAPNQQMSICGRFSSHQKAAPNRQMSISMSAKPVRPICSLLLPFRQQCGVIIYRNTYTLSRNVRSIFLLYTL